MSTFMKSSNGVRAFGWKPVIAFEYAYTSRTMKVITVGAWSMSVAIALPLARAYPAPTWPDALSRTYRAAPEASASEVWAEEQRLAGLQRQVPAWGALRAIPLAGCAALALSGALGALRCRRS